MKIFILVKSGPEHSLDEPCTDWFWVRSHFEARVSRPGYSLYNNDKDFINDDNNGDNDGLAGEEKHEDGGGGKQLQILHKGDEMLLFINQSKHLKVRLKLSVCV